jgi:hypothetical protein
MSRPTHISHSRLSARFRASESSRNAPATPAAAPRLSPAQPVPDGTDLISWNKPPKSVTVSPSTIPPHSKLPSTTSQAAALPHQDRPGPSSGREGFSPSAPPSHSKPTSTTGLAIVSTQYHDHPGPSPGSTSSPPPQKQNGPVSQLRSITPVGESAKVKAHFDDLHKDLKTRSRFVPACVHALYLPGDRIAVTFAGQSPNKAFTVLFGPANPTNDDVFRFFLSNKGRFSKSSLPSCRNGVTSCEVSLT